MSNKNDSGSASGLAHTPTRRRFLKTASVTAAAGSSLVGANVRSETPPAAVESNGYDVIVVGAGFAGVTAARDIAHRGLRVLLLEARPRLGGRTFTSSFAGHSVDLGGTWIGWSQPFVWAERMRYGIEIEESAAAAASQVVWMDGEKRVVGTMEQYAEIYGSAADLFYEPARSVLPRPFDPLFNSEFGNLDLITARQALDGLDLTPVQRDMMATFTAINGHSFANQSSYLDQLRWYALGDYNLWNLWDNLSKYRLKGGTKSLLDRMHEDADIETRMGTPVARIEHSTNGVTVVTKRGEQFPARAVVMAMPLNCVADIEYRPEISAVKLDVSRERHTGSGTKVYARVGKHPITLGHGRERDPLCFAWTEYDDPDSQLLCGFGASPSLLDVNDDDAVQAAFAQYLPGVQVRESASYDWNLDPYSKGTWCMYRPGVLSRHLQELQRPEGNIFFAGGDIANGWRGFIDGAIESGARSAVMVTESLARGVQA